MTADLSTENATRLERALEVLTRRIDDIDVPIADLWSSGDCLADVLPWLAFGLSVDTWRPEWPVEVKRAAIAASIPVHRRKGTVGALVRALQAVAGGVPFTLTEWHEPGGSGDPFTATIEADVSEGDVDAGVTRDLVDAAEAARNVRTHLSVRLRAGFDGALVAASLLRRPVIRAVVEGLGEYRPAFQEPCVAAALLRRPMVSAFLPGSAL